MVDLMTGTGIRGSGELGIIIDLIVLNDDVDDLENGVDDLQEANGEFNRRINKIKLGLIILIIRIMTTI
jgi:hypothetical protein